MPLFAFVPFVLVSLMVYAGKYANEKEEIAALKKEYARLHGKTPKGALANDLNWLRKETKTAGRKGNKGDRGLTGRGVRGLKGDKGGKGDKGDTGKDAKDVRINNTINNHYYAASGSDSDSDTLIFDDAEAGGAAAGGAAATWNAFDFHNVYIISVLIM